MMVLMRALMVALMAVMTALMALTALVMALMMALMALTQDVAVKALELGLGGVEALDPDNLLVDALKRALAARMRLSWRCRHATRYLGYALQDGCFCVVMPLCPQSLTDLVSRAPLLEGGSDGPDGSDGSDGLG